MLEQDATEGFWEKEVGEAEIWFVKSLEEVTCGLRAVRLEDDSEPKELLTIVLVCIS